MYDELVKALHEGAEFLECSTPGVKNSFAKMCHNAADAIEDLEYACNRYEKDYKDLCAYLPKWIPATERLPEIDEKHHCSKDVLAYLNDGGMCFTALEENIFGQVGFECERNPAVEEEMIVTHWMPLPEPPKEE